MEMPIYKDPHTTKTHKTHIYTTHIKFIRLVRNCGTHIRFIGFRKLIRFTHATKTHKTHHKPMCDSSALCLFLILQRATATCSLTSRIYLARCPTPHNLVLPRAFVLLSGIRTQMRLRRFTKNPARNIRLLISVRPTWDA